MNVEGAVGIINMRVGNDGGNLEITFRAELGRGGSGGGAGSMGGELLLLAAAGQEHRTPRRNGA